MPKFYTMHSAGEKSQEPPGIGNQSNRGAAFTGVPLQPCLSLPGLHSHTAPSARLGQSGSSLCAPMARWRSLPSKSSRTSPSASCLSGPAFPPVRQWHFQFIIPARCAKKMGSNYRPFIEHLQFERICLADCGSKSLNKPCWRTLRPGGNTSGNCPVIFWHNGNLRVIPKLTIVFSTT